MDGQVALEQQRKKPKKVTLADHINRRDTKSINRIGDDLAVVQIALKKS